VITPTASELRKYEGEWSCTQFVEGTADADRDGGGLVAKFTLLPEALVVLRSSYGCYCGSCFDCGGERGGCAAIEDFRYKEGDRYW
jgi:hypothetical protein